MPADEVEMRVVVVGATGNVGTAVLRALGDDPSVDHLVGVARRVPDRDRSVEWISADLTEDDLLPVVRDADVVVHLAWLIQPGRDLAALWKVNVDGTIRLLDAVSQAKVPAVVYASSVGAYSPGRDQRPVDESYPTHGIASSSYSRQKAYVERLLDVFERDHPGVRVARLRPALIFQRSAAEEQRRYFVGSFVPRSLLRPGVLPVMPHLAGVRFQAVHADDVADAYRRAVVSDAHGAFNVAAEPILSTRDIADLLGARAVPVPPRLVRIGADLTWRLRLHPVSPGWVDLARKSPLLDSTRIRTELEWRPHHDARDAVNALLTGVAGAQGGDTPTLAPRRSILRAVRTGHGQRMSTDRRAEVPSR